MRDEDERKKMNRTEVFTSGFLALRKINKTFLGAAPTPYVHIPMAILNLSHPYSGSTTVLLDTGAPGEKPKAADVDHPVKYVTTFFDPGEFSLK